MKRRNVIKRVFVRDTMVSIRPICPNDFNMEQEFIQHLSEESRYFRFMDSVDELSPKKLKYLTEIDYDRHMAFVATIKRKGKEVEIGVARYVCTETPGNCEFGIAVDDAWQGSGVAGLLMIFLKDTARDHGFKTMGGIVLPDNDKMLKFARKNGFKIYDVPEEDNIVHIQLRL